MRAIVIALAASLAAAGAASAAQVGPVSNVEITFGKDIQRKPRVFGEREKTRLAGELREAIEKEVGTAPNGGRLELVIEDVKPNRPTFTEQSYNPGLSYFYSVGIGGARIKGVYVAPDGTRTPIKHDWYEYDLRQARYSGDWGGAEQSFELFARNLAKGRLG